MAVCARYAAAQARAAHEDEIYRVYLTDALYALSRRDSCVSRRYADLISPLAEREEEDPQAVIDHVRAKLSGEE